MAQTRTTQDWRIQNRFFPRSTVPLIQNISKLDGVIEQWKTPWTGDNDKFLSVGHEADLARTNSNINKHKV